MQRLAAGVERQGYVGAAYMHVNHYVGIDQTHARTFVGAIAVFEPVDYGILDAVCHKARVRELVAVGHSVNLECLVDCQQLRPVVLLGLLVKAVGVFCSKFEERFENAQGGAAA